MGFEAIDGYSSEALYAVGWAGEVWKFDGAKWSQAPKLTDAVLTAVCCAPDNVVYQWLPADDLAFEPTLAVEVRNGCKA